ncbi:MAG: hypothetical protein KDI12_10410, partial [Anaerolineae bacterium]|nr:hypothetical protein [Anaerolineae bacterium]
FEFEFFDELMNDPWELLVRLGGGALSGSSINIFGTIWNVFRGERDLDKILDNLFRIDVGGLGIDLGVELGFSATADFGKCPEDADIQDLENRLQEIARRLDRLVADQVDFSSPSLYKIPLHAIVAVQLRIRLRLGGAVNANGLTMTATGQGSIGGSGRVAITPGFSFGFGAYVIVSQQVGKFINGLLMWVDVIKIVDEIINLQIPDGDCDPDPPDPRPPDERQDVWQGVESFYQGATFEETISNLSTLIQRAQEQDLWRAERLLTVRLRDAELGSFMADREQAVEYADNTLAIMEAADIRLQEILSGTVPISPSLTLTEALAANTTAAYEQIYAQPYPHQQQALMDAVAVAERFYGELQGQELELQQELRQLLAGDAIGVLASGFAESTLSALDFIDLPATLISPWPAIDEFRGR